MRFRLRMLLIVLAIASLLIAAAWSLRDGSSALEFVKMLVWAVAFAALAFIAVRAFLVFKRS